MIPPGAYTSREILVKSEKSTGHRGFVKSNQAYPPCDMYVYVYVVWKAATSATMLMVNDLTRYKAATLPLHIRYISAFSPAESLAGALLGRSDRSRAKHV